MRKVVIIILFLVLCSCNKTIIDELPDKYYLDIKNNEIDIYSKTKLSDIIDKTNINYGKDIQLDTSSLGEKILELNFTINKKNYIYHIKYEVKDLTKPKILSSTDRYITVNSDVYVCDYIMYGDNYDSEPICRVEGEYDLNKIGKYNIKYIVSDQSGNEEYFETVLHVIENNNESNTQKYTETHFNDIYRKYKTDKTKIGIDVSRWQGDIDYSKVKASGAEFVIMRIGVESKQGEELGLDTKYKQNIVKAKEAGLKVGVYLYSIALDTKTAEEHANWVLKQLDGETLDLGVTFDWENFSKWNTYKLSFYDINNIANTFLKIIEKKGYKGMLYSSKFYLENIWNLTDYPIWLAHYTDETSYKGDYYIWQMCNDGIIDGIYGAVDIDIMYLNT